jgi:hypothetical protein
MEQHLMINNAEWLAGLKAGDRAAVSRGYGYSSYELVKVDRVTHTQVIVGGSRFRRDNGRRIGDRWESIYLVPISDQITLAIAQRRLNDRISPFRWTKLNLEQIQQIDKILDCAESATNARSTECQSNIRY